MDSSENDMPKIQLPVNNEGTEEDHSGFHRAHTIIVASTWSDIIIEENRDHMEFRFQMDRSGLFSERGISENG